MAAGEGFKAAMADLAETIRRAFKDPPCQAPSVVLGGPASQGVPPMTAQTVAPEAAFRPGTGLDPCILSGVAREEPLAWQPRVQGEAAWEGWSVATAHALPLFREEPALRMEVPPLPRRAQARRQGVDRLAVRPLRGWNPLAPSAARALGTAFPLPRVHAGLDRALAMPVAVTGEDLQAVSKALWMRYMLHLVRSTGQNIRNLEVIGLYRIPAKGARQVHHDPVSGRLLVTLGPEALHARRAPFILARQKDDHTVVCCFVETT